MASRYGYGDLDAIGKRGLIQDHEYHEDKWWCQNAHKSLNDLERFLVL